MKWHSKFVKYAGGVTNVGFPDDSKFFMVVSHSGRGLYCLENGERVFRDYDESCSWHHDTEADGIGPLQGIKVPIYGIHADLPEQVLHEISSFDLDAHIAEFKGAALSNCRKYLAIAYSDEVQLYDRT